MMSKRDYEKAATITQGFAARARRLVVLAFVELFSDDNPRFDAARFRRACEPGANVRARGRVRA
jgi:hypothetical protein